MNFTAVVAEVLSIVKRQDKILDIRREVNAAVSFYCQDADFKRDLEEVAFAIDPQQYTANIPYSSLTRFRKFRYIKQGRCYLTEIMTSRIQECGSLANTYYMAGSGIRYSLGALSATLDLAYFQYPPTLTDAAPNFWMLDLSPYMVINRAAGRIFDNIGDDKSSSSHSRTANEIYLGWRQDHLSN